MPARSSAISSRKSLLPFDRKIHVPVHMGESHVCGDRRSLVRNPNSEILSATAHPRRLRTAVRMRDSGAPSFLLSVNPSRAFFPLPSAPLPAHGLATVAQAGKDSLSSSMPTSGIGGCLLQDMKMVRHHAIDIHCNPSEPNASACTCGNPPVPIPEHYAPVKSLLKNYGTCRSGQRIRPRCDPSWF